MVHLMAAKSIKFVLQLVLQQNRQKAENRKAHQEANAKQKELEIFSLLRKHFRVNLVGVMGSMVLLICWRVVPAYRYISKLAINDIDGGTCHQILLFFGHLNEDKRRRCDPNERTKPERWKGHPDHRGDNVDEPVGEEGGDAEEDDVGEQVAALGLHLAAPLGCSLRKVMSD